MSQGARLKIDIDQGCFVFFWLGRLGRLIHLRTVEGISVEDRRAIEQIHCECPAPLPVILDCEVQENPDADSGVEAASTRDCKLAWKPR